MGRHAQGNTLERHTVAGARLRIVAAHQLIARFDAVGRENVGLFAVIVLNQGDARRAIGIILDGHYRRPHTVFAALEINQAIHALMATAAKPCANNSLMVAAALLGLWFQQALFRLLFPVSDFAEVADRTLPASGSGRFILANTHDSLDR